MSILPHRHKLTASHPLRGSLPMSRRRVLLVAVLLGVLALLGSGGYFLFLRTPAPATVKPTEFQDTRDGLPSEAQFAELARTDPVALLDVCLSRYTREVAGFRATLEKQEFLGGTLHPVELLKVSIREKPVAVSMRWIRGARPDFLGIHTQGVAYVEGENKDAMLTWRPEARLQMLREKTLDPKDPLFARKASRYCIKDAGFLPTMLRTRDTWAERQKAGELRFVYHGVRPIEKLGNRPCHVIERTCPHRELDSFSRDEATPTDPKRIDSEGFDTVTIYIDAEHWIQTGTELKRSNGDLMGSYFFRDLERNPMFDAQEFKLEGLKRAP